MVRLYDHLSYQDCHGILSHPQGIPASGGSLEGRDRDNASESNATLLHGSEQSSSSNTTPNVSKPSDNVKGMVCRCN